MLPNCLLPFHYLGKLHQTYAYNVHGLYILICVCDDLVTLHVKVVVFLVFQFKPRQG